MKKFIAILIILLSTANLVKAEHKVAEDYVKVSKGSIGLGFQTAYINRRDIQFQSGIFGKYYLLDNVALRLNLRFGRDYAKGSDPEYIIGDTGYDEDIFNIKNQSQEVIRMSNFMLVFGAEHRHKLSNRFFGYYGADLGIGGYGMIYKAYNSLNEMIYKAKYNRSCDVSIQPFIGLDFFVGPKISLSLEAGYDVLFKFYRHSKTNNGTVVEKYDPYTSISSHIDFGNCVYGAFKAAFYF